MKKIVLCCITILCLAFIFSGCSKPNLTESKIKEFITILYQVESTEAYEEYLNNIQEQSTAANNQEDNTKLTEPLISKYKSYCTDDGMELLLTAGYSIKYQQLALQEGCQLLVKDITITKDNTDSQYNFIVQIEKKYEDGTEKLQESKGTIKVNQDNMVDWIKITQELTDI